MMPLFAEAAKELKTRDPPIILAKVDATKQNKLADDFGIKGFPTLFFMRNGEKVDFDGGRDKEGIMKWAIKKSVPASKQVDCETLKEMITTNKFLVTYFGSEDTDLYREAFYKRADAEMDLVFVHTDDEACAKGYELEVPGIMFVRDFESSYNIYSGSANDTELLAFYRSLKIPYRFVFDREHVHAFFQEGNTILVLFRNSTHDNYQFVR
jgi:thiol-disulfide isomerase/thioredoxin